MPGSGTGSVLQLRHSSRSSHEDGVWGQALCEGRGPPWVPCSPALSARPQSKSSRQVSWSSTLGCTASAGAAAFESPPSAPVCTYATRVSSPGLWNCGGPRSREASPGAARTRALPREDFRPLLRALTVTAESSPQSRSDPAAPASVSVCRA